jgi:hypothetical protein
LTFTARRCGKVVELLDQRSAHPLEIESASLSEAKWPDFYIVGAPRCGTTFMHTYLKQHPDVFMPDDKEHPFFCRDLHSGTRLDRKHFLDESGYLARLRGKTGVIGDACAYDLFSTDAAREIHARRPDARIIACVREPADQMRSFHHNRIRLGVEDLSFDEALAAAPARARGERMPRNPYLVPMYQYEAVARFEEQIERYVTLFGSERVAVFRLADTASSPAAAFTRATRFLGLADWLPESFEVVDPTRKVRHRTLDRVLNDDKLIEAVKHLTPRTLHPTARRAVIVLRHRIR